MSEPSDKELEDIEEGDGLEDEELSEDDEDLDDGEFGGDEEW